MQTYQNKIINETVIFRQDYKYPVYPPYHSGKYLEDKFYDVFIKNELKLNENIIYLPIFWTTVYNDSIQGIQQYLNTLDKDYTYVTVCHHDDAVREILPPKTIIYAAGGNKGGIPIPLVCSEIPNTYLNQKIEKKYLASFIGSDTHFLRNQLHNLYKNDEEFYFRTKQWNPVINQNELEVFFDVTQQSKFCLCPRGYGLTSFRLYESFQLNSVPVYISDVFWLPFTEDIDWKRLCVFISPNELPNLKNILNDISEESYNEMLSYGKECWEKYFKIDNMVNHIYKQIKKI
jgi:hypothetical protein